MYGGRTVSVDHTYVQRTDTKYTLVTERDHTGSAYVGGVPGSNVIGGWEGMKKVIRAPITF
jgi:hypothetical protein